MPAGWTKKDERQYEQIKDSTKERGVPKKRAKQIAASTVNKTRRAKSRTPSKRAQGTGNGSPTLQDCSRGELYEMAREQRIPWRTSMSKNQLIMALQGFRY